MGLEINKVKYKKEWPLVRLKELCNRISDGTHFTPTYVKSGIPFISVKDIYEDVVHFDKCKYITSEAHNELIKRCYPEKDDILITKSGTIGRMAFVPAKLKFSLFVSVALIKNKKEIIGSKFLKFCLQNFLNSIDISQDIKGGLLKNFHLEDIRETLIPVVSLNEQNAIVLKLEELLGELDKGIENLHTAQHQLKIYRQSILDSAFKGILTEVWRKNQKELICADSIIEQIQSEKEKESKINGNKHQISDTITEIEYSIFPQLPKSWVWVRPDNISSPEKYSIGIGPFGSNLKVSDYKKEGIPLVFVKNITRNNFSLDLKYISQDKFTELIAHSIKPFDIVITKMGDPPGDCAIYPENRPPAIITSDCLKFRIWDKFSNRKFYKYCIETDIIKKQLGLRTKGVAQKKISSTRFKTILFPFTNREEQDEIVRVIESRLSVADKMEETITQCLNQAESLRQSILIRAFEGDLG